MNEMLREEPTETRPPEERLAEALRLPAVQEALQAAQALIPEELRAAIDEDRATSHSSWSRRDYLAQRLTALLGLEDVIKIKRTLGKDTSELEASQKQEAGRLARFSLDASAWSESAVEPLPTEEDLQAAQAK